MFHAHQRKEGLSKAIFSLWLNWAVAVGLLALLAFLTPLVKQTWIAPLCLAMYLGLQMIRSAMKEREVPVCSRIYQEISVILLIITAIVLVRYFFTGGIGTLELTGQAYNPNGPLLGVLVSAPVTALIAGLFLLQKSEPLVCQLCHLRYGNVVENGFIGKLYRREWRYQSKTLMWLSILLTVADWSYYIAKYVNVNLNRADYFFFLWMPLVIYALSLIYLGWRYYSLWVFYCHNDEWQMVSHPSTTTVRYIVLAGDKILLDIRQTDKNFENGQIVKCFDTPASYNVEFVERMDHHRAAQLFRDSTGIKGAKVRRIYESPDTVTFRNVFHYFAFLDDPMEIADSKLNGEWFGLGELRQLMAMHLIGHGLNAELSRIYRVAMAWKTYDRDGRRLYRFKHYRPTFRLKDIREWDVDYGDGRWLEVGKHNEDSRFYRLRSFLKKLDRKFHSLTPVLS